MIIPDRGQRVVELSACCPQPQPERMRLSRGLCFWGRWWLATLLLDIATVVALLARRAAPKS
jgi:hypothetical protein